VVHRPLAERIFRATGRQVEFLDSQSAATLSASSQIESSYDSRLKQGNIKVLAPGHDAHLRISEAEHAFRTQGAEVVFAELPLQEPATTAWFALRIGRSTFGIFDAFPDEAGRNAHLAGAIAAALMAKAPDLLATPPVIEKVEILAAKLPG